MSADRFGAAYYVLGVATSVPDDKECKQDKDAAVVYTPVQPHAQWLLNAMVDTEPGLNRRPTPRGNGI